MGGGGGGGGIVVYYSGFRDVSGNMDRNCTWPDII